MDSKIYVFCPYGLVTGGPDALHQMVYYLNSLHKEAHLVYLGASKRNQKLPDAYRAYIQDYLLFEDVKDEKGNIIVLPEFISQYQRKFKKAKVYLWWLSVDYNLDKTSLFFKTFFFLTIPLRFLLRIRDPFFLTYTRIKDCFFKEKYDFQNQPENVRHLCASYYALDHVKKNKREGHPCIEPISKIFLSEKEMTEEEIRKKKDIILYNPAKSEEYVQMLKKEAPDLPFFPLRGLSQSELIQKYREAKMYIDFGPFPGAERMPKEAVLNHCLILTGRRGASGYHGDVPIKEEYKIEGMKENVHTIISMIKKMLSDYVKLDTDFDEYRKMVSSLEENFIRTLEDEF